MARKSKRINWRKVSEELHQKSRQKDARIDSLLEDRNECEDKLWKLTEEHKKVKALLEKTEEELHRNLELLEAAERARTDNADKAHEWEGRARKMHRALQHLSSDVMDGN